MKKYIRIKQSEAEPTTLGEACSKGSVGICLCCWLKT